MPLPFGPQFVGDVVNRTHVAQDQAQCLLAAELVIKAQLAAKQVTLEVANGSEKRRGRLPRPGCRIAVGNWLSEEMTMASFMDGNPALKGLSGDLKRRMDAAVATFQASLASTRTGRASAHMLDQIKVDYYGTMTPINQMAQVGAPEPQSILIQPWDPSILKEIEKAIQASDLGFNPISDGKVIRVPVPPMTELR